MPELPELERAAVLARLAEEVVRIPPPARVGVDGVDAAGKTILADELATLVPGARRISADEFLRPPVERYRRGRSSAEGYYDDSFDHDRLRGAVLAERGVVLVDGIFLYRPELNDLWDFRIFVHVELEESIRRGAERDAALLGSRADAERLYRTRYAPGQQIYLRTVRPWALADIAVDNTDPSRPKLYPGTGRLPSVNSG